MLQELLNVEVFGFMLVFIRIGSALSMFPGFSAAFMMSRARLFMAFAMAFVTYMMVKDTLPPMPANIAELFVLLFKEVTIGVFLGLFAHFIAVALDLAGSMMGHSVGFSNSMAFDPTLNTQSTVIASFLSFLAFTLIIITDMHHLMLGAVFDSYTLFAPGKPLPFDDFVSFFSNTLTRSMHIGFQISAPFFLMSVIFNVGTGVVSRLMPQLHVLFVMMPLQVYLGLTLLFAALTICMTIYMNYFRDSMMVLLK